MGMGCRLRNVKSVTAMQEDLMVVPKTPPSIVSSARRDRHVWRQVTQQIHTRMVNSIACSYALALGRMAHAVPQLTRIVQKVLAVSAGSSGIGPTACAPTMELGILASPRKRPS